MISFLRIERFKCFNDVTIRFGKITLLSGINGAGKSTVIQSLLLLRQAYVTGRLQQGELPLNGEFVRIGTARDALFRASLEDSVAFAMGFDDPADKTFRWKFNYERDNPDLHFMRGDSSADDLPESGIFSPRFSYLTAERVGPRVIYPMSELSDNEIHVGFSGEYTPHVLAKFGYEPIPASGLALPSSDGKINRMLSHQTQLWMRHVSPNVAFNAEEMVKADQVHLGVRVYGEQTDYLRPTNMGFGICYTLPVIVAGLMTEPGSVLIVENPEAHLHPAGQSHIARFLARVAQTGVQVIIESHSDHILNGIRIAVKEGDLQADDTTIQFICRDQEVGSNRIENLKIYQDGGIDRWPEGFFDQMEKDLEALF